MDTKYTLGIIYPGEDKMRDEFKSNTPFGAISTGDIIRTKNVHEFGEDGKFYVAKATNVEHLIMTDKDSTVTHAIYVNTEYVES